MTTKMFAVIVGAASKRTHALDEPARATYVDRILRGQTDIP